MFLDVDVLAVVEADVLESFVGKGELRRHSVVNSLREEIGHFGIQTVLKKRKAAENRGSRITRDNGEDDLRRGPASCSARSFSSS